MEEEKDLNERLEDLKEQLKTLSKDPIEAEKLLNELLSVKSELDVEPSILNLPIRDIVSHLDGNHFDIYETKYGALYKTRGGYYLYTENNNKSLYETLMNFINQYKILADLDENQRKLFELDLDANGYILALPLIAFADEELKLDIATKIVDYLRKQYETLTGAPLQKEDKEADNTFRAAVEALSEL